MKAILVSRRFNPGHISHIEANAKLLEREGFEVELRLNRRFRPFFDCSRARAQAGCSSLVMLAKGDLFVVWFPSVSVVLEMLFVRLFTKATSVYVYHEPYTSFASYRAAGFSWAKVFRVASISLINRTICMLSDKIILPSMRAFDAVPEAKLKPHRYAKINLMFADESDSQKEHSARNFISYIGTIAEDHAFDEFICLMQTCIADNLLQPRTFLIATRSQIPKIHRAIVDQCVFSGRLILQSGSPMTNHQINNFYSQSFVVWNAYKRSMQSGVLPKAYMFGTPVLMSLSNQSEYFRDGEHGVLISDNYGLVEFCESVEKLELMWSEISHNCRNYYLCNFDYNALSNKYMNFVLD